MKRVLDPEVRIVVEKKPQTVETCRNFVGISNSFRLFKQSVKRYTVPYIPFCATIQAYRLLVGIKSNWYIGKKKKKT